MARWESEIVWCVRRVRRRTSWNVVGLNAGNRGVGLGPQDFFVASSFFWTRKHTEQLTISATSESGACGMRVARGRGCMARWESEIVWCVRRVRRRPSWNVVGVNAGNRGVGLGPQDFSVASSFFLTRKHTEQLTISATSESGASGMRVARGRGCMARWESEIVWCVRRVRRRPSWNVVGLNAGNRGVGLGPQDFSVASSFFWTRKHTEQLTISATSESGACGMRVARGRGCMARWESEIVWCVRRVRRRPSWNVVGLNAGNRGVGLGPQDFSVASSFFGQESTLNNSQSAQRRRVEPVGCVWHGVAVAWHGGSLRSSGVCGVSGEGPPGMWSG